MKKNIFVCTFCLSFLFISNNTYSQTCTEDIEIEANIPLQAQQFGWSCKVDGNRIATGGLEPPNNIGKVYVFDWDGTTWTETIITASDGANYDGFGANLDLDGDRLVVGSRDDDDNGSGSGSVYIYDFDGTSWIESKITASDGDADDWFGSDVAVDGNKIIVGAEQDEANGFLSGSAYVFQYNNNTSSWTQIKKLDASNGVPHDQFGNTVDIVGDRMIVGGKATNNSIGAVYVYDKSGPVYTETILTASDGEVQDFFAIDVALGNDILVSGAFDDTANGVESGSAYVFEFDGTNWSETAKLIPSDGGHNDAFGWAVAIHTDVILVGAHNNASNATNSGSAYRYEWDGSTWGETKYFPSNGAQNDRFGAIVSVNENMFISAAPYTDGSTYNEGSVYIFDCCLTPTTYYEDMDGDGFGNPNAPTIESCLFQTGYVTDNTDCDDTDANINPGSVEVCDELDNNCDGAIDEGVGTTYYADSDGDNYGDPNTSMQACILPSGYVLDNTDCDDTDSNNYPGNTEVCDGVDNNCDGIVDEGCSTLPPCDDVNLVIPVLLQDTNRAEINIQSDALINSSNSILYTAGTDIDLQANFEVTLGTVFEAKIEPCDNN